jgi:hypothetical protein
MREDAEPAYPAVRSIAQIFGRVVITSSLVRRLASRIQVKSALTAAARFYRKPRGQIKCAHDRSEALPFTRQMHNLHTTGCFFRG